jgi:hypothetical protein
LRRVVQADLKLQPRSSACWTAQLLSAFQGLRGCELYVQAVQTGHAITMQEISADLKHRMRGAWRDADWWTPTRTTTNWPPIILGLPSLFLEMSVCQLMYHGISILICKHVMCNISRFRLRAHTLKFEAAAWLEDGSCVCDLCPGEDEHFQNEVHALLFCQDHRVCEPRKHFSFLFTPLFEDFSAAQPFLL